MKKRLYVPLILTIIVTCIYGIVMIYSASSVWAQYKFNNKYHYVIMQSLFFIVGIILMIIISKIDYKYYLKKSNLILLICFILLVLVLIPGIGTVRNGSRSWFGIGGLGIQPSEFMKIFLIITLSRMIGDFNEEYKNPDVVDELKFLLKVMLMVFIPSVLTFIEPDTGAVIMYLIITFVMLFVGGFRKRWFIFTILVGVLLLGAFLGIYYFKQDLFIQIFGTSFFYRMDRITNWSASSGLQLRNSMIAIGSSGVLGHGINHTPIYFPEMQTDFIFAVFSSNTGFIGALILIMVMVYFDLTLISYVDKTSTEMDKYAIGGIIGVLLFQQIYNISMTIGLLPIMGITLPFISYGGSSLLSYMLLLGIVFNVSNESLRFTN